MSCKIYYTNEITNYIYEWMFLTIEFRHIFNFFSLMPMMGIVSRNLAEFPKHSVFLLNRYITYSVYVGHSTVNVLFVYRVI